MRTFVAVDLDPSITERITSVQAKMQHLGVKPVKQENLHFTLKFLGEINESTLKNVSERLSKTVKSIKPFDISLKNMGLFPNSSLARVIWVGTYDLAFIKLHENVNTALLDIFKPEKPTPHLTIARARSDIFDKKVIEFAHANKNIEIGQMKINEIRLKKSTLTKEGPIYEDILKFRLAD